MFARLRGPTSARLGSCVLIATTEPERPRVSCPPTQATMESSSQSEFAHYCQECGAEMSSPRSEVGSKVECPGCSAITVVPDPTQGGAQLHSEREQIVKFHCVHCDQRLSSPTGFAGRSFDCPNCGGENLVPGNAPMTPPPAVEQDMLKFFCGHCGQKLACDHEAAGRTIDCPICGQPAAVPGKPPTAFPQARTTRPMVPKPTARLTPPPKKPSPPVTITAPPVPEAASTVASRPVVKPPAPIRPPEAKTAVENPPGGKPEAAEGKKATEAPKNAGGNRTTRAKTAAGTRKTTRMKKPARAKKTTGGHQTPNGETRDLRGGKAFDSPGDGSGCSQRSKAKSGG